MRLLIASCCALLLTPAALPRIAFAGQEVLSLDFSTFLDGAAEDSIRDVTTDAEGAVYLTGGTASEGFPATPESYDTTFNGVHDVFVAKLDRDGQLLWSTLLGGPTYDRAYAIEVDRDGNVYVAGRAGEGFPTTQGVVQRNFGGDVDPNRAYGPQDGFIAKLSPDGSTLLWASYFGSKDREVIRDLDLDAAGDVYVVTTSVGERLRHVTAGSFQPARSGVNDAAFAKITADGTEVVYASYFGGSGPDGGSSSLRVAPDGEVYLLVHTESDDAPVSPEAFQSTRAGGLDLFLAKISADGSTLLYGTYFGGSATEFTETHGLTIAPNGVAYIAASTESADLPTTAGAWQRVYGGSGVAGSGRRTNYPGDGFVAKISANGKKLLAATYLGGSLGDGIEGSGLDGFGGLWVSGATFSNDFPVTADALQPARSGGADAFAARLSTDLGRLLNSTYLGGSADDFGRTSAVTSDGHLLLGGMTRSADWPLFRAWQGTRGGDWGGALARLSNSERPAAPSDLSAKPRVGGRVRLRWRDNSDNETEFRVQMRREGRRFRDTARADRDVRHAEIDGLLPATEYSFRVRAFNGGARSKFSNPTTILTAAR